MPRLQWSVARRLRETIAFHERHREKVLVAALADLVNRHDVRMIELGGRLGFGQEPLLFQLGSMLPRPRHLEGDDAVQFLVPGLVDNPHPAAGDLREKLVVAEAGSACVARFMAFR